MPKKTRKVKINGTIVGDNNAPFYQWFGISATWPKMIADALEEAGGDPIDFYINSPGGSVPAGSEIYSMIKEYEGETVSKITGFAASAATFIAMATDKTQISPMGQLMVHNAATGTYGNRHNHEAGVQMLQSVDEGIASAYSLKTGKSIEELMAYMDKETWINAQKAVELGFADEIMFTEEMPDVSNNASSTIELPQEVIDKLRNELLKNDALKGIFDNKQVNNFASPKGEEGDTKAMNLEELKANHPALYEQVLNLGVTQERDRITELNALADAPGASEIVANAIANGETAAQAAIAIVKAAKERLPAEAQKRSNDAQNSGINNVPPSNPPEAPNAEQVAQAEADAIVAEMKRLRGEK